MVGQVGPSPMGQLRLTKPDEPDIWIPVLFGDKEGDRVQLLGSVPATAAGHESHAPMTVYLRLPFTPVV